MNHYLSSEKEYELVPIKNIIIDSSIVNAVKKYGGKITKGMKIDPKYTAPLNRMEPIISSKGEILISSVLSAIKDYPLPPVILKPYGKTGYYLILDGRHRVAASIISNFEYVPAYIELK